MAAANVLLIVLDSVRASNVSIFDYHRDTTPFLREYSDEATVYTQARAPGIHSVASHASLWTGAHVEQHQVKRHGDELRPGTTIWEVLEDEDYRTGLFTTNPVVSHSSNLADMFDEQCTDEFVDNSKKLFPAAHSPADVVKHEGFAGNFRRCLQDDRSIRSFLNSIQHFYLKQRGSVASSKSSSDLITEFFSWSSDRDRSWAACINLMDAHFPYEPATEHDLWGGERLQSIHTTLSKPPANEFIQGRPWWQLEAFEHLYDGAIREIDHHVEKIITGLKQRGMHDDTLIVITSDHGEGFGELSPLTGKTRLVDHSWGIDEALTHVPLLVNYPDHSGSATIDRIATLAEFYRTVEALLGDSLRRDSFAGGMPVVASTDRLFEADDGIFDGSVESPRDYYGPWRAVYEHSDEGIRKYSARGDDAIREEIPRSGDSIVSGREEFEVVDQAFDELPSLDLRQSTGANISGHVEDRLTELGYLR